MVWSLGCLSSGGWITSPTPSAMLGSLMSTHSVGKRQDAVVVLSHCKASFGGGGGGGGVGNVVSPLGDSKLNTAHFMHALPKWLLMCFCPLGDFPK